MIIFIHFKQKKINYKMFVPLLLLIGLVMAETEKLERNSLKEDPNAVCNDGTPGIYYWKKSPTGSNRWLLFLTGGEACVNKGTMDGSGK